MKHIEISTSTHIRLWIAAVAVLACVVASGSSAVAQGTTDLAIDQAQRAVREQITSPAGARNLTVQFDRDTRSESPSNALVRVRGTGSAARTDRSLRRFSYEAVVNTRTNAVSEIRHDWLGNWANGDRRAVTNPLTGTYRLNPTRSESADATARRVTRTLPAGEQERLRTAIMRRLEAPESLVLERNGRTMTIASSTAARVTFEADGREQLEQSRLGRQVRTNATLVGNRLVVTTEGDRSVDYQVTFDSIDNGRSLAVTRRITDEGLRQPVVARSVYDKTSDTPQWDVSDRVRRDAGFPGRGLGRGRRSSSGADQADQQAGFSVPDGTEMVAVLNEALTTKQTRDGDRFALTVRTPAQYAGAVIEGSLARVARSGQVAGRAEMSFVFDTIRLRNGRLSDFGGNIESVRTLNNDSVRVDNEGTVQDEGSQTGRTVTRTGIGAAIGAVIGAIAGGGQGAAVGAAVGAGAGAGSVFIQGRNDLDLTSGTEFTIRASSPR